MESLLKAMPNSPPLCIFRFEIFPHNFKEILGSRLGLKAAIGIYFGNEHGLHRIYLQTTRRKVTPKHVSSNKTKSSLVQHVNFGNHGVTQSVRTVHVESEVTEKGSPPDQRVEAESGDDIRDPLAKETSAKWRENPFKWRS